MDFDNFCILLQKIALMRFPPVEKYMNEWAATPSGRAVLQVRRALLTLPTHDTHAPSSRI
jgi:hypothetical protein